MGHKAGGAEHKYKSDMKGNIQFKVFHVRRASRVPGSCKRRSSSLASTTSPNVALLRSSLRSLRPGMIERTACSNSGHISSDVLPRNETSFALVEPEGGEACGV